MTPTPETLRLRDWAASFRAGVVQDKDVVAAVFDAAADAWEQLMRENEALREAAQFKRCVIIWDDPKFIGRWVAVPEGDFNALRSLLKVSP